MLLFVSLFWFILGLGLTVWDFFLLLLLGLYWFFCLWFQDVFDSNNTRFERLMVDGKDDIYASIRQSTGPKLVTRTNDRIEI